MILGVIGIAIGVLNYLVVKNPPEERQANQNPDKKAGVPLSVLLTSGRFWLFGLGYLFTGFSILVPFTFLNTYAVQELSLSYDVASYLMIALGIGAIVSKIVIGPISDKTGRLKMIFLCGALICLGCLGMAYRNTITLFIAAFVFALGYGAVWAMYAAAASDYFAKESSGTIIGIWTLFLGVGSVLSPIITGWVADATGTLTWSFGVGAVGGLISVVLLVPLALRPRSR
jgi:MFS family permease